MDKQEFEISQEVEFHGESGIITSIELLPGGLKCYHVSYMLDGQYKTISLYDFEMRRVGDRTVGFGPKE